MNKDVKLRLKQIHYNYDQYRGCNTCTDEVDLNDGEYEKMTANNQKEELILC